MKRDDFLKHVAWTGTGIAWSLSSSGLFNAQRALAAGGGSASACSRHQRSSVSVALELERISALSDSMSARASSRATGVSFQVAAPHMAGSTQAIAIGTAVTLGMASLSAWEPPRRVIRLRRRRLI